MADAIRVLYVDDEPLLLEIGKMFLEDSGEFSVTVIESSLAALEILTKEKFDAIISDYQMPGLDGIQFLVEVRKRVGQIPFILFTGKGREEVVIQAINNGADFYLQKGGEPNAQFAELSHKIKSAIERHTIDKALKKSEKEILESKQELSDIIEFLPDATFVINKEGTVIAWNRAIEVMTGVRKEDMIGKGDHEYTIPFYGERRLQLLDLIDLDNDELKRKYQYVTKKGNTLYAEVFTPALYEGKGAYVWATGSPLFDIHGNRIGAIESIRDISDSKQAEATLLKNSEELHSAYEELTAKGEELQAQLDALVESENKFKTLVENIPQKIFMKDQKSRYIAINEKFAQDFGIHPGEMVGKSDADLFPAEVAAKYRADDVRIMESGQTEEFEEIYLKEGTETWVHTIKTVVKDNDGGISGVCGVFWDITDSKLTEEALRESEERYRSLIETLPDMIWEINTEGIFRYISSQTLNVMGYEPEYLIGKAVTIIIPGSAHPYIISKLNMQSKLEKPFTTFEVPAIHKDGHNLIINIRSSPIFGRNGELTGFRGIARDITEKKREEEALSRLTEFQDSVITNARVWMSVLDLKGNILIWNTAAEEISGYTSHEVKGKNEIWKLLYPEKEYRKQITETITRIIRDKNYLENFETTIYSRHGDNKIISWNTKGIPDSSGKIADYIAIGVDVTDKQMAKNSLHQANKKLTLLSSITRHDINNQLMVLKGYLSILAKKQSDPKHIEYFQKVEVSVKRISDMIRFTKVYEEIGVNAPAWQDCHSLVEAASKDIHFEQVIFKNEFVPGTEVFADPLVIRVFYNLIDNAVRYAGNGRTIRFFLEERKSGNLLICEDNGAGVSFDEKERIFERGFGKNTGFGLFLIREVLSITGILIEETGEPGKGARFEMKIPNGEFRFVVR